MKARITIRRAKPSDARTISNVGKSLKVVGEITNEHTSRGFLRGDVRAESYLEAIKYSGYFLVAVEKGKVVGFVMGYPTSYTKPHNYLQAYVLNHYSKPESIFIDQVGVLRSSQGRSIGKKLYETIFKKAKGMKVVAGSWASPYNRATELFHLKMGFRKVARPRGVTNGRKTAAFIWVNDNGT